MAVTALGTGAESSGAVRPPIGADVGPARSELSLPPWLRELYPFRSHFLNIDGVNMHYVDEGAGPPLVMLHGNPTWSFYFRELIKGLRDRFRVIVPDHVGCGLSDKPAHYAYTLSTHIDNVERLIRYLGLGRVSLAVHDWGGAIGFGWACRHVAEVSSIVVFNTAAFLGPVPWRIRVCRWPVIGSFLVRRLNGFARAATVMATTRRERMTRNVRDGYLFPYDSYEHRVGVHGFVRDIPVETDAPSRPVIESIEAALPSLRDKPILICWGGRDFCFHDGFLTQWRKRFPAAVVHRFADAGHYVVEDAWERIAPIMRDWLEQSR